MQKRAGCDAGSFYIFSLALALRPNLHPVTHSLLWDCSLAGRPPLVKDPEFWKGGGFTYCTYIYLSRCPLNRSYMHSARHGPRHSFYRRRNQLRFISRLQRLQARFDSGIQRRDMLLIVNDGIIPGNSA